jgi:hypothetical protein
MIALHRHPQRMLAGGAMLLAISMLAAPTTALAGVRTGHCSGAADWEIEVYHEDGRVEVEFEVDHSRSGSAWTWTMKNDGTEFAHGKARIKAHRDSFSVSRLTVNGPGHDHIVVRAVNVATGQVCRATATI